MTGPGYCSIVLYGRDAELRRIVAVLDAARSGDGRALVIRGEAGIGKTALLDAALAEARAGGTVLRAAGVESEVELGFGGLHQLLGPVLPRLDLLPAPRAGAVRHALGLAGVGNGAGTEVTDLMVCAGVLGLLRELARRRPVVLAVDDVHRLDRASLQVVLFVARRLAGSGLAVLLTARLSARDIVGGDLPELRLAGLSADAAGRLLDDRGWRTGEPTRAALVRATGGNPLALAELADRDGRTGLALDALRTGTVPVGPALRDAFTDRVAALPPPTRDALLVAAVEDTGRPDVIAGAATRLALPPDALAAAEAAGLVTLAPHAVRFRHPLARSAVRSSADPGAIRRTHAALADQLAGDAGRARWHRALAADGPDDGLAAALAADAEELARRGGLAAAAALLRRAATLAADPAGRAGHLVAAAHAAWKSGDPALARALLAEAGPPWPDDPAPPRVRALLEVYSGDQPTALAQLERNAERLVAAGEPGRAVEQLMMAVDAAVHADEADRAVAAARRVGELGLGPEHERYGRWLAASVADELTDPLAAPWRVVDAAPEPIRRSGAHRWLIPVAICRHSRDPQAARQLALAAHRDLWERGMLAVFTIPLLWLVELEYRLGLWPDAAGHAREGLRCARDCGQPPRIADLAALLALLAAGTGDETAARRHADEALHAAAGVRNHLAAAQATWALGLLDLAAGEPARAAEHLASLRFDGLVRRHARVALLATADTVEAHLRAGHPELARRAADELERWLRPDGPDWAHAAAHRCRALLAGDTAADKEFAQALAVPGAADRPFDQARTLLLHGQWLRRERRGRDARQPLRQAGELFENLGAARWTELARGELRAAGGSTHPGARPSTALTGQELRVARLAAEGLSNREIGERLRVSHRTAGYHLAKVFRKLGVTTRAQLRTRDLPDGDD